MATASGPQESYEPSNAENIRIHKSGTGSLHTHIGESHFYSKHGIKPIADTLQNPNILERQQGDSPIKMKTVRKLHEAGTKFPKLEECAHFHYDYVELKSIQASLSEENPENTFQHNNSISSDRDSINTNEYSFLISVSAQDKGSTWVIKRTFENFRTFDRQLHKCIFDRKYSLLPEIRLDDYDAENIQCTRDILSRYLHRFSVIAGNMINCGPVLSWLEMDNRGNRVLVTDDSSAINTPAVSAAHVIKRYQAQAQDELTLQVGDFISIIDMPQEAESVWWRGKNGFEVGFFPCECVEVIGDKIPQAIEHKISATPSKPVLRKRGKLITLLRSFFSSRPARTQLKKTGIVKERVFGCDLGEHLLNSKQVDVPLILKKCTEVIEEHGIVDGIYRLSGVASNIQKLRNEFDEEKEPNLRDEVYLQDIHSISSLLKAYFRELPNPLLTYQLYDKFADAVKIDENKLLKIHDVIQQLPPPHYRTAEALFFHLNRVSKLGVKTGMHCKNLAIVWAPNLMRSKELDRDMDMGCSTAMLQGVGVQAIVTELLIQYPDLIFDDKLQSFSDDRDAGGVKRSRPKSLAISTPTKLLSLEEAREQILREHNADAPKQKYIEVGGGPSNLPVEYHTVIELPSKKKGRKSRKSPNASASAAGGGGSVGSGSSWRSIFSRGSKNQNLKKQDSTSHEILNVTVTTSDEKREVLRAVHSVESLASIASSSASGDRLSDYAEDNVFRQSSGDELAISERKSSTFDRPKEKKAKKSSRRSMSADLTQSESDFSEQDEMLTVSMETVPQPKGSKKSKPQKDAKRAKKKSHSRSNSDGPQATELLKMPLPLHQRSKSEDKQAHYESPSSLAESNTSQNESQGVAAISGTSLNKSPSLKERVTHALTPTSPRKKIKGPAPCPPSNAASDLAMIPSTKSKKKSSKKAKKKSSETGSLWVNNMPPDHSIEQQEIIPAAQVPHSTQAPSSVSLVQLSPIEEGQSSDMNTTPDRESHGIGPKRTPDADFNEPTLATHTDMSMSFDSLLKEMVGSDSQHVENDGNLSTFGSTFGKTKVSPAHTNGQVEISTSPMDSSLNVGTSGQMGPPTPKPRKSIKKQTANTDDRTLSSYENLIIHADPTSSKDVLLETDMDSFENTVSPQIVMSNMKDASNHPYPSPNRQCHDSEEEADGERFNYVAPLPGDVKMTSQYPDLIAPNLLSQIDLDEIDVQYVDPYNQETLDVNDGREPHYSEGNQNQNRTDDGLNQTPDGISDVSQAYDISAREYHTARQEPEGMVVTSPEQSTTSSLTTHSRPDIINESISSQIGYKPMADDGQLVFNKPTHEGSIFIPTKSRVLLPPRQFAHSGPPLVSPANEVIEGEFETNIDTVESPFDDFPPPPKDISASLGFQEEYSVNKEDGYAADRSSSSSPVVVGKDQFHEQLNSVSKPVLIEENPEAVAMAISPMSKTPESDVAMVTSSIESEHMTIAKEQDVPPIHDEFTAAKVDLPKSAKMSLDSPEIPEAMFIIEDIKKSQESLHNASLSSDDALHQSNSSKSRQENACSEQEVQIENTYYQKPTQDEEVRTMMSNSSSREIKKPTPVKRKKSVKELLSRFEISDSAPSEPESKGKTRPVVFQKPKLVRLQAFPKSGDVDDVITNDSISDKREVVRSVDAMSVSCPETGRLLQSSSKIVTVIPDNVSTTNSPVSTPVEEENSITQLLKKPTVRNKIQQFETSVIDTSIDEQTATLPRGDQSPHRPDRTKMESDNSKPLPPDLPKSHLNTTSQDTVSIPEISNHQEEKQGSLKAHANRTVFPAVKVSNKSPQTSRRTQSTPSPKPDSTRTSVIRSSFKMRSAGSGSSSFVEPGQDTSPQLSLSDRLKRFDTKSTSPSKSVTSNTHYTQSSNSRPRSDNSVQFEKQQPDVATKNVQRSISEPADHVESQNPFKVSTEITEEIIGTDEVLRPSQLFASRRGRRPSDATQPKTLRTANVTDIDSNAADIMTSSFSDRRKLFESSLTDSGISSLSYGSLKRSEYQIKPKQQNIDNVKMAPSHSVVHRDIELSHNEKATKIGLGGTVAARSQCSNNDQAKYLPFGQKTVVIESKSVVSKSDWPETVSPHRHDTNAVDESSNISVKAMVKSTRTDQKENMRPPLTIKSDLEEKKTSMPSNDGVERSGSVKDLWRKFESQNTHL